ncbi:hypothetical protein HN358_04665 [Candidatus Uhrbacteria bacterium]|jgi:hypothetical protein|nr:hypothetical protein [Candidatus Uhrbacteria bacterium]MBT7717075.1 hypothetical protein [Candidatus Uhrbacteria bacterium]
MTHDITQHLVDLVGGFVVAMLCLFFIKVPLQMLGGLTTQMHLVDTSGSYAEACGWAAFFPGLLTACALIVFLRMNLKGGRTP